MTDVRTVAADLMLPTRYDFNRQNADRCVQHGSVLNALDLASGCNPRYLLTCDSFVNKLPCTSSFRTSTSLLQDRAKITNKADDQSVVHSARLGPGWFPTTACSGRWRRPAGGGVQCTLGMMRTSA